MKPNAKHLSQTIVVALLGLAACGQESPTAPESAAPLPISAEERATLGLVVGDAVTWLVPALEDRAAAAALRDALGSVSAQLGAGSKRAFDQALERAQSVLVRYEGSEPSDQNALKPDAPLLAMIRLALDQVTTLAR
jgi:hypothetical protein